MLYKEIGQSFKDVDVKAGIVTGYFSSFGTLDSDGDIVVKGAFQRTISENGPSGKKRIKHLLDHNTCKVVAVPQLLEEHEIGLYYESKAGRHTLGQDFLKMAEDGIITEHSFGYRIVKQQSGEFEGNKVNFLTELKMWEGSSMQAWGANMDTPVTGIKSLEDILDTYDRLTKALKSGTYSDETFLEIEARHKKLSELIKTTLPGGSTDTDTTKPDEREDEAAAKAAMNLVRTFKLAVENGRGN